MVTLRMDLEGLKLSMVSAFEDKLDEIKNFTTQAIDAVMKNMIESGSLERIITETVDNAIREAMHEGIQEAVDGGIEDYFTEGNGKSFVIDAIMKRLEK